MIFLTVGTQLPFDRLCCAIDEWAGENPSAEIFGQIGPVVANPKNFEAKEFVSPLEFDELFQKAQVVVAHAGMGSILTALKFRKPIIIFPRRASLGEHRNEHQLATAKRFLGRPGVSVAFDIPSLYRLLSNLRSIKCNSAINAFADEQLLSKVEKWISTGN